MTAASVIVPARDAQATLGAALDALAAQDLDATFEVIVVDDGSRDGTAELAERHPLGPRVIRRDPAAGHGPGAARNAGAAAARGPVLAFTDADCSPEPQWLAAGLAALARGADLVQGRVVPAPGVPIGPYDRTIAVEGETGLYETASLFVAREWFGAGFEDWAPELGGRGFGEDTAFAWRARRAGARIAFAPRAAVHHAVLPGAPRRLLAERARLRLFPALVARVPELRAAALHRGVFLSRRTAAFDLAAAAGAVAAVRRSPLPLLAALPYARRLAREAPSARAAAVIAAADAVGCASLLRGSVEARTPIL